jgi:hypothetical protein
MNELAIDTEDLAKTYAGIRAVGGINLTVPWSPYSACLGDPIVAATRPTTLKMTGRSR